MSFGVHVSESHVQTFSLFFFEFLSEERYNCCKHKAEHRKVKRLLKRKENSRRIRFYRYLYKNPVQQNPLHRKEKET